MTEIIYDEGVRLENFDLWFDAKKRVNYSFVSHANFNSIPKHQNIIATPETIKLLNTKINNSIILSCPYNRQFSLGRARIELIPSGYMLGAAQIVVEIDGRRIIYTGDLKLRFSSTARFIELRRCDVLVMKCKYGQPDFYFPDETEVMEKIFEFVKETMLFDYVPIIVIEDMGKVLDLIRFLGSRYVPLSIHRSILKTLNTYSDLGYEFLNYENFRPKRLNRRVVVIPPYFRGNDSIENIEKKRICAVSGWASNSPEIVKSSYKADQAFALSNNAGYDELIQYIEIVKPKEIYLIDGFCVQFAASLKKLGFNAKPIQTPVQLSLF